MKILNRQVKAIEIIVWPLLTLFVEIMLLMHWPELTLKVIFISSIAASVCIILSVHFHSKEGFKYSPYIRVFLLLLSFVIFWLLLLICMLQFQWLSKIESNTRGVVKFLFSTNPGMIKNDQALDVSPITLTLFTLGIAVVSFASYRQIDRHNPYTFQEYYYVDISVCGLLALVSAIWFFVVVKLKALQHLFVVLLLSLSVSQSVYFYLFHNERQIEKVMARILIRKLHRIARHSEIYKSPYVRRHYAQYCEIFDDLIRWYKAMILKAEEDDLSKIARHHLSAVELVIKDRKLQKKWFWWSAESKEEGQLIAFVMGYYTLFPSLETVSRNNRVMHAGYYHAILELCAEQINRPPWEPVMDSFISGLLFARLQFCFDLQYLNRAEEETYTGVEIDRWHTDPKNIFGTGVWNGHINGWLGELFWYASFTHIGSVLNSSEFDDFITRLMLEDVTPVYGEYDIAVYNVFDKLTTYRLPFNPLHEKSCKDVKCFVKDYCEKHQTNNLDDTRNGGAHYDP